MMRISARGIATVAAVSASVRCVSTGPPHPPKVHTSSPPSQPSFRDERGGSAGQVSAFNDKQQQFPISTPPRLPDGVARLVVELLGDSYVNALTDVDVSNLRSERFLTVYGCLSGLYGIMKFAGKVPLQPIEPGTMEKCATDIAALNRPATLPQIIADYLFSDVRDLAEHNFYLGAVNATGACAVEFMTAEGPMIEGKRVACVTAVVGPSGAGKTTYSIKAVSEELKSTLVTGGPATPNTPIMITHHTTYKTVDKPTAEDVYGAVRDLCGKKGVAVPEGNTFLKDVFLHVIVDECESFPPMSDEDFAKWRCERINYYLKGGFAGVHITLAGTMLDVRMTAVGSESAGFRKIRLHPWSMANFKAYLAGSVRTSKVVRKFVDESPMLMSLTTNARTAVFLVYSINACVDAGSVRGSHRSILDQVVFMYLKYNGLARHTTEERACVGLSALRCALGLHINADTPNTPSVIEEQCIRSGLLSWNVEVVKGIDTAAAVQFKCVDDKPRIGMQPALVLVCLVMCELLSSSPLIEGWAGVEHIAALWAACSIPYPVEFKEKTDGGFRWRLVAPDCRMPYVHMSAHAFGVQRPMSLLSPPSKANTTYSPRMVFTNILSKDVPIAAVINADQGCGMDVVAPWLLVQAKHNVSSNSAYSVDVMEELEKAGLFVGSTLTPLTTALVAAWRQVPNSTPPAVLTPLSHLLEHIPKNQWDTVIAVGKGNALATDSLQQPPAATSQVSDPCVLTQTTVASVPKGCVRVVLLLFGHSFLLKTSTGDPKASKTTARGKKTSDKGGNTSPRLLVEGPSGCVRLLTVSKKTVEANTAAVPSEDVKAIQTLAAAVSAAKPAVDFVLDVVYQPLQ